MKVAGLFAGVGGFELGLCASGHETVMLCEIWEPARAVLKSHFPDVPCHPDVETLSALPPETEMLVAGFPCQDLSQAGQTRGIDGSRSGLVNHIFRLLDLNAVPWVVLENVSFMLQLDKGRAMTTILDAFEERGYRWAYRVVNSLSFLPQRRERVLLVATRTDIDPASVLLDEDVSPALPETDLNVRAHGFYWTEGVRGLGWAADAVPTLKNGSTVGIPSPPAILLQDGAIVTPDIRDAERLQGFPPEWTKPAEDVGRASARWSLVGNAVTVPVTTWLGGKLERPGHYDKSRDRSFSVERRLPRAARYDGASRHVVDIGSYPVWRERLPLADFLQFPGKPLSIRATRGFLLRTERSALRFTPGFQDRLRQHLALMESASRKDLTHKDLAFAAE